jgi:hypothetical protein
MENRYTIELSESQMRLISDCLEDASRFAAGQCNLTYTINGIIKNVKSFDEQIEKRDKAEELLKEVKKGLLPELTTNSSYRYNENEFIGNTYQIYRTILHQLAIDNNRNNVHSSPALPSGTMGTIKITKLK